MIPKGYKHTELGVLPEDWEVVRLGDVCEIKKGKVNPKKTETIPCVELEHISQDTGMLLGFIDSREQLSIKNSFSKGDVLFGKLRPYLRKFWRASFDGVCSSEIWVLQGKKVSNAFLFYLVQTARFSQIANATCGTKMPRADWKLMQDENFAIPPLAEQEKIAEILSTWDTQIQNFETLIAEKQALKKGLCQTLLTAKTRLKGFSGDWEVVRLGDVCDVRDGTHESPKPTTEGKILITSKNLKGGKIDFLDSYHISLEDFEAINKRSKVEKYDILMSMIGTVGEVAFVDIEPNFAIKNVVLFKMDGNEKFSKFLFFFFQSSIGKKHILGSLSGSTQKYITLDFLRNLQIPLPPFTEQEKIAEILSEVDNEITLLEQKLEFLKSQKRGLMQKLLNGKVRVNNDNKI